MPCIWRKNSERLHTGHWKAASLGARVHDSESSFEYIKLEVLKGNVNENGQ